MLNTLDSKLSKKNELWHVLRASLHYFCSIIETESILNGVCKVLRSCIIVTAIRLFLYQLKNKLFLIYSKTAIDDTKSVSTKFAQTS